MDLSTFTEFWPKVNAIGEKIKNTEKSGGGWISWQNTENYYLHFRNYQEISVDDRLINTTIVVLPNPKFPEWIPGISFSLYEENTQVPWFSYPIPQIQWQHLKTVFPAMEDVSLHYSSMTLRGPHNIRLKIKEPNSELIVYLRPCWPQTF